ncbi:MAG: hypothetical protein V3S46_03925 [Nitrospinota bacterium]
MAKLTKTEEDFLEWIDTYEESTTLHNLWLKTADASFEAVYRTMDAMVQKGMVEKKDGNEFKLTLDGQSKLAVIRKEAIKRYNEREKERRESRSRQEE